MVKASKVLIAVVIIALIGISVGAYLATRPPPPPGVVHIKFTLDWLIQGPQAPFILAFENGYFAEEGLSVAIHRGFGSADAISKVAAGAYDMGYGSLDALIEFNAKNPGKELVAVYMVLNHPPYSIVTLKDYGIRVPKDLEGKKLGAPEGDAPRRLFPAFVHATGIDRDKVSWVSMAPPLREPMLVRKEVDAVSGFYFTVYINLVDVLKVPPENIIAFHYAKHGVDVYGNAVVVRKDFLAKHPEAVRGFLRALTRAMHEVIADPEKAIDFVKAREPIIDKAVELKRLKLAIELNMLTPEVENIGYGAVDMGRLTRTIEFITTAFALERKLSPADVFSSEYLPPLKDRLPKV